MAGPEDAGEEGADEAGDDVEELELEFDDHRRAAGWNAGDWNAGRATFGSAAPLAALTAYALGRRRRDRASDMASEMEWSTTRRNVGSSRDHSR